MPNRMGAEERNKMEKEARQQETVQAGGAMTRRPSTKLAPPSWHPRGHQARGVHLGKHVPVGFVHHLD